MIAPLRALCSAALTAVLTLPQAGLAQIPDLHAIVQADVLPGWREADGTHYAGLRLRLAPGWKTYWRVPGEGGIPPVFDLQGSANLQSLQPLFPRPTVYRDQGMISIGYSGEVVFPLRLTAREAAAPITLRGKLMIGVCEAVCIPADIVLNAVLPAPGQTSALVAQALRDQPQRLSKQPACRITPTDTGLQLALEVPVAKSPGEHPVIETANPEVWVAPTRIWRESGALHVHADLYPPQGGVYVLDRSALRVTVLSESGAQEMIGCAPR